MFRPVVLVERPGAGRLEAVRLGVRVARCAPRRNGARPRCWPPKAVPSRRTPPRGFDSRSISHFTMRTGAAIVDATVRNTEARPIRLDALLLGFRWTGHGARSFRWLRHGWQSWSVTEAPAARRPRGASAGLRAVARRHVPRAGGASAGPRRLAYLRARYRARCVARTESPVSQACTNAARRSASSMHGPVLRTSPVLRDVALEVELRFEVAAATR